jgi:hypothetical protein
VTAGCHNAGARIVLGAMTDTPPTQTFGEMLEELIDLSVGFGVAFLPALLLAIPCIVLVVVPVAILLLPLAVIGALLAGPPYLIARLLRRRRRPPTSRPVVTRHPRRRMPTHPVVRDAP